MQWHLAGPASAAPAAAAQAQSFEQHIISQQLRAEVAMPHLRPSSQSWPGAQAVRPPERGESRVYNGNAFMQYYAMMQKQAHETGAPPLVSTDPSFRHPEQCQPESPASVLNGLTAATQSLAIADDQQKPSAGRGQQQLLRRSSQSAYFHQSDRSW